MLDETHLAKALQATGDQTAASPRGLYDQAAKEIVADRQILARIVKECVAEAAPYSEAQLEQLIPADLRISAVSVGRDEAAADPGTVRQENTEDGSVHEGTVHFDILFTLELPDAEGPVLLLINVEVQNSTDLPYPLARRAMVYASRLVGRQGTDYANCKKVYSVWIVSNPQKKDENTLVKLVTARQLKDGSFVAAPEAAQVAEVWFLNLGERDDQRLTSALLGMLDTVFSTGLTAGEKRRQLQERFGLRMTAAMTRNLEDMQNMELAIEARAREKWMAKGMVKGIMQTALAFRGTRTMIMDQLIPVFHGNRQEAEQALNSYIQEHPEEAAYLED